MPDKLILDVYRTHAEGALQVALSQLNEQGTGWGYRIAGPKHYNMGVDELLSYELDERDANRIREMLDAVFPPRPARVITDPADLDALPAGSVAYARGKAYTAVPDFDDETQIAWLKPGAVWAVTSAEALERARGSLTVLHTPENGDNR